jgi:hypothetical protein
MNEILDLLAKTNEIMLGKIAAIKDQKYVEAIIAARKLVNEAENIIAKNWR